MRPWLKLYKSLKDWEWKDCPEMIALWIDILLEANDEPSTYRGELFEEGTFPTSVDKLSKNTGLSTQTVRTCLKRLEKTGEVTIVSTSQGTKISVVKWPDYQSDVKKRTNKSTNELTNEQQTANKQLTTLKEYKSIRDKEYKNNNTIAPSSFDLKAVASLPLNKNGTFYQVTEEEASHYKELYPGVNVEQELRNMVGWLESNPAKRKTQNGVRSFINRWLSKAQNSSRLPTQTKGGIPYFDINGDLPSLE